MTVTQTNVPYFRQVIAQHSKSFALASRLLPEPTRSAAAIVYAWCRRCDDAIDGAAPSLRQAALVRLEGELDQIYSDHPPADPVLSAFARIVRDYRIPRQYPYELLSGMRMDVEGTAYPTLEALLLYCYRVAGVVGIMMCHVMGVRDRSALRHAVHLGIGMQLTNICRDVVEDWRLGRMYLPANIFARYGCNETVRLLLFEADRCYRSGDAGLFFLPFRSAMAVRAARLIYSGIGRVIARRGYDVLSGRAATGPLTKVVLLVYTWILAVLELPRRISSPFHPVELSTQTVRFPGDVLPI